MNDSLRARLCEALDAYARVLHYSTVPTITENLDVVMPIIEADLQSRLAAKDAEIGAAYEDAACVIDNEITNREEFENHLEPLDVLAGKIRGSAPASARAALAERERKIFQEFIAQCNKAEEIDGSFLHPLILWAEQRICALEAGEKQGEGKG